MTMKILGIIGIILSALGLIVVLGDNSGRIEDFVSWLFLISAYTLAFSIITTIKASKFK